MSSTDIDADLPKLEAIPQSTGTAAFQPYRASCSAFTRSAFSPVIPAGKSRPLSSLKGGTQSNVAGSPASSSPAISPTRTIDTHEAFKVIPSEVPGGSLELESCVVCGDEAHGKHFGVVTCEACKSFFRRSVRRNSVYACVREGKCEVTNQRRTVCQYCRFKRCLFAGMRPHCKYQYRSFSPTIRALSCDGYVMGTMQLTH